MGKNVEIEYLELEENIEYNNLITKIINKCFEIENLQESKIYISVTLTNSNNIKELNKKYRNIESATDVLSFPMFEKEEIKEVLRVGIEEVLGDIIISIEEVEKQAKEYNHSFERELAYMTVHGFYHLIGEDHVQKEEKKIMREKEEKVLNETGVLRWTTGKIKTYL